MLYQSEESETDKRTFNICCLLHLSINVGPFGGDVGEMNEWTKRWGHHGTNAKNTSTKLILEPFLLLTHSKL